MPDREKVLKGLTCCEKTCKSDCPYWINMDSGVCISVLQHDALELLKEQEPVEPKIQTSYDGKGSWWYICGSCNKAVNPKDKYCRECGRELKWDENT